MTVTGGPTGSSREPTPAAAPALHRRGRGVRRLGWLIGLLSLVAATAVPALAQAEVRRYAFLVGSNKGAPHEQPLLYAESDVDAVAATLINHGGFASESIVRLQGPTAGRVRKALLELGLKIQADLRNGGEAVLFAYYSGHADAQSLHLGGTELATEELSNLVRLSQAKLKVLLLDACRSGALTRVKGGRPVAPFQIGLQDLLRNEGYAIITSSSAGEDAQESEALRSSIFTHHFLAGLRGPADISRDRMVTLGEAYNYAAEQTLKTSLGTLAGSQHATFEYDLRGRADPVLSDLRRTEGRAELVLETPGEYLLLDGGTGALLFEAMVKAPNTPVIVEPGRYRVRARTRREVFESEVTLASGGRETLRTSGMRSVPLAQVVRKGETAASLASGPTVGGSVHGPIGSGFSATTGVSIGWAFELPRFSIVPRLGFGRGRAVELAGNVESHTLREITAEVSALYVFDLGPLAVAPLVSAGWAVFRHEVSNAGVCQAPPCTETSVPQGLLTTVGAWGSYPLGRGFSLESTVELANFYLRRQESRSGIEPRASRSGVLTYRAGLGLGYRY
ncbi:MAG TPA: caspase family protein [Polyangia bacterium]